MKGLLLGLGIVAFVPIVACIMSNWDKLKQPSSLQQPITLRPGEQLEFNSGDCQAFIDRTDAGDNIVALSYNNQERKQETFRSSAFPGEVPTKTTTEVVYRSGDVPPLDGACFCTCWVRDCDCRCAVAPDQKTTYPPVPQ